MPSNLARALAVLFIVLYHWLIFLPWNHSDFQVPMSVLIHIAGTFVQIFFVMSGYGLVISYEKNPRPWKQWIVRRVRKILIPYWIIVIFTFILAAVVGQGYSLRTLAAYLTLTRNFFEFSWGMNESLWFMPVITGLYLSFPLLIKLLKRYGAVRFLIFCSVIAYGFIGVSIALGHIPEHQNAFFLAGLPQFALGMALADFSLKNPKGFRWFQTPAAFAVGFISYGFSAFLAMNSTVGNSLNDLFTAFGLCAILMATGSVALRADRKSSVIKLSNASYILYLIHVPIITFIIKPFWNPGASAAFIFFTGIAFTVLLSALIIFLMRLRTRFTHPIIHREK